MNTVNVIVIKKNVVSELFSYPDTPNGNKKAECKFVERMSECLSNYDSYTEEDIDACKENGIAKFGTGSICITHNENTDEY